MPKEKKPPALREQALAYLARREHSRAELARKLEHAGHPAEEIAALLDEFEARNWLSDRRFAESYLADHRSRYGSIKLEYELRQRGIADHIIRDVLDINQGSELDRARETWCKKFGKPPATPTEKAKQIRFLLSRGFPASVVQRIFSSK